MKYLFIFAIAIFVFGAVSAQSLEDILDDENSKNEQPDYATATFKSDRIINSQSVKGPSKNELIILISHRFGLIDGGFSEFYGLDNATIRLGADYGITDRFTVGFGRSTYKKNYDFFGKYKILRQSSGKRNMPVTLSALVEADISSAKWTDENLKEQFSYRMSYAYQLLLARKFSSAISLQLMPAYIHRNLVETKQDENDPVSLGFGGRIKFTSRVAFTWEYHYLIPGQTADDFENSLSLGFDIETGGHVFQLFFSNSSAMYAAGYIPETVNRWDKKEIRFGFNISRVFSF